MIRNKLANLIFKNLNAAGKRFEFKAEGDETTIYLYDIIDNWYGIDSESFIKSLQEVKSRTINLRINSPGGDVFDARAIRTALMQHPAKVIAHIDGLAASAATYIAIGADEVRMADGAFFMIHKAWTLAIGNADEIRSTADLLDKVDDSIANDYHKKTAQPKETLVDMMAKETWMNAQEAKELGFVDIVTDEQAVENSFDLSVYDSAPKPKAAAQTPPEEPAKPAFNARTPLYQKYTEILERANA